MKCSVHPKYKAIEIPTADCACCRHIFDVSELERQLAKANKALDTAQDALNQAVDESDLPGCECDFCCLVHDAIAAIHAARKEAENPPEVVMRPERTALTDLYETEEFKEAWRGRSGDERRIERS
jgi:hypothetical protein